MYCCFMMSRIVAYRIVFTDCFGKKEEKYSNRSITQQKANQNGSVRIHSVYKQKKRLLGYRNYSFLNLINSETLCTV